MKYLLIGIDGCQEDLIHRYEMPFMQKMLSEGKCVKLKEDLFSRGWAEICTGLHAIDSGAYYERPVMNGTHKWTTSYNLLSEKFKKPDISTIWDLLNCHDYSVGIMNVPTTNPAPPVNGFFVSGGGGGREASDSIDANQCHPKSIKVALDKLGYIVDERVPSLLLDKKLFDEEAFFARLKLMTKKRVEAYLALNKTYDVDFGFFVFRSFNDVELIVSAEITRSLGGEKNINKILIQGARDYYLYLDSCIENLCSKLNADKMGFVSDHGLVMHKYSVNLNVFLRENGFLKDAHAKDNLLSFLKKHKDYLPYGIRAKLKRNRTIAASYAGINICDPEKSLAFANGKGSSFFGIYVNDTRRFGGYVKEGKVLSIANKITAAFNVDRIAREYGFTATCQIGKYKGDYSEYWPDVLIETPDGYSPNIEQQKFVDVNHRSMEPTYLADVKTGMWSGTKGKIPLSCFFAHDKLTIEEYEGLNLTAVFNIVKNEFGI